MIFSMEYGQCYSEFEEFYNIIASLRVDLLKYVDENPDILNISNNSFNK